jgi:hypothetical protein
MPVGHKQHGLLAWHPAGELFPATRGAAPLETARIPRRLGEVFRRFCAQGLVCGSFTNYPRSWW